MSVADGAILGLAPTTFAAAVLASLVCGTVGTIVVLRRLVALGGGIAHAAFGGVGLAALCGFDPRLGAAGVALAAAAGLARLPRERNDRQDAAIGVVWAVGMAFGILLVSSGGRSDLEIESILFGEIERARGSDVGVMAAVVAIVVASFALFGRELVATAFDAEQARISGLAVGPLTLWLMLLVAFGVVALLAMVGIVLAIALLAIPPLVALRLCRALPAIVAVGTLAGLAIALGGLLLAARLDWAAGPTIVLSGALLLGLVQLVPRRSPRATR